MENLEQITTISLIITLLNLLISALISIFIQIKFYPEIDIKNNAFLDSAVILFYLFFSFPLIIAQSWLLLVLFDIAVIIMLLYFQYGTPHKNKG